MKRLNLLWLKYDSALTSALVLTLFLTFVLSCRMGAQSNRFGGGNQEPFAPEYAKDDDNRGNDGNQTLPGKPAPEGMVEIPSNGVGRILTSQMSGTNSARKMLSGLRMGIDGYFDQPPTVTAAFADNANQNLQAAFTAKLRGVPVRGIMAIEMRGDSGQATMVFDRAAAFAQTFARITRNVNAPNRQDGEGRAPQSVQLTNTPLLDGSGQIGLPLGWRVTGSFKGTVDTQGPRGEQMSLGGSVAVAGKNFQQAQGYYPMVDFNDSVQAALDYAAFNKQQVKVLDTRRVQLGNFPAAYVRFYLTDNKGERYDGLGLYSIQPTDANQGLLYMSYLIAPAAVFKQSLPGAWAAWLSWGIKDEVFRERMNAAVKSMRETGDILTSSYQNRQDSNARVNQAWSNQMRDEGIWRDPADPNTHYRINNNDLPPDSNTGRLEPVPVGDLHL